MVESPSSQRTVIPGNNYSTNSLPGSYKKSTNEYTWCYENSASIHTTTKIHFNIVQNYELLI